MAQTMKDIIAAKKKALAASSGSYMEKTKPAAGKSQWRILPGWRADERMIFWHDFAVHFVKMELKGKTEAIIGCNAKTYEDKKCNVCLALNEAELGATDAQKAILKESRAGQKFLVNALHVNGPAEKRKEPQILELGKQLFEQLLGIADEYDDFHDLETGTDMIITREGSGMNTEYKMTPARRSEKVDKSVLAKLHNLDDEITNEFSDKDGDKLQKSCSAIGRVIGLMDPADGSPAAARDVPGLSQDFDEDVDDKNFDMDADEASSIDASADASSDDSDGLSEEDLSGLDDLDSLLDLDDVG